MREQKEQNMRKPSIEQQSEARFYKQRGNQLFKNQKFQQAIAMYDEAISRDPLQSIYFSNKSRCLFNLKRFQQALETAQRSIKLDEKNIKAHYLAAECLVEISESTKDKAKLQSAIQSLKKSLTLCPSQGKGQFQRNFIDKIYKAKKKLWFITTQHEGQKKKAVRKYLIHLVETDQNLSEAQKDQLNDKVQKLTKNEEQKDNTKVPTALVCPLTKKLLKDPVCNEHGHSYSREAYIKHLETHGDQDPITKKPVKKKGLMYQNFNVKKAVELFIQEHPWAYDQIIEV